MFRKPIQVFIFILLYIFLASPSAAQKSCFTSEARELAERTAIEVVYFGVERSHRDIMALAWGRRGPSKLGPHRGSRM